MFQWLRTKLGVMPDDRLGQVQCPNAAYTSPVQAIAALLNAGFKENEWASFDARDGSRHWATVQVRGAQVNTLTEPVELIGVLRAAGLETLANKAQPADMAEQRRSQARNIEFMDTLVAGTLYSIPGATPTELAEAVNAVYTQHYGFSAMYELHGSREH